MRKLLVGLAVLGMLAVASPAQAYSDSFQYDNLTTQPVSLYFWNHAPVVNAFEVSITETSDTPVQMTVTRQAYCPYNKCNKTHPEVSAETCTAPLLTSSADTSRCAWTNAPPDSFYTVTFQTLSGTTTVTVTATGEYPVSRY